MTEIFTPERQAEHRSLEPKTSTLQFIRSYANAYCPMLGGFILN